MEQRVILALIIYFGSLVSIYVFFLLYRWARKRKAAAIGVSMLMHMIMPVPAADKSVVQVVEKKQVEEKKVQQKRAQPK